MLFLTQKENTQRKEKKEEESFHYTRFQEHSGHYQTFQSEIK
jgi:hypothetical protein